MSQIDKYQHNLIGFIECPSTFNFVFNNSTRKIAIYELLENITKNENSFDGKVGDIILGGGSGEAPAFRISMPEALNFFFKENWDDFKNYEDLFKTFWNPTQSFILCEGFLKLGWNPSIQIEFWLAENVVKLLQQNFAKYNNDKTSNNFKSHLSLFQ